MEFCKKVPTTTITFKAGQEAIIAENSPVQPVEPVQIATQLNSGVKYYNHSSAPDFQNAMPVCDDADFSAVVSAEQPLAKIGRNENTTDSTKRLRELFELLAKLFPHLVDLIKVVKAGNPKNLGPLLDTNGIKELMAFMQPLIGHSEISFKELSNYEKSVKDVWEKIKQMGNTRFRKVKLTKALQSKYKAAEIQESLDRLESEGLISRVNETVNLTIKKGPGASKSPLYKINKVDESA